MAEVMGDCGTSFKGPRAYQLEGRTSDGVVVISKTLFVAFVSSPASRSRPPLNAFHIVCDGPFCAVLSRELRRSPVTDYYRTNGEDRSGGVKKKYRIKSMANDRHRVSCGVFFLVLFELPGPDLELYKERTGISRIFDGTKTRNKPLTRESQDPVHKLIPSLLTPRQLTRFS